MNLNLHEILCLEIYKLKKFMIRSEETNAFMISIVEGRSGIWSLITDRVGKQWDKHKMSCSLEPAHCQRSLSRIIIFYPVRKKNTVIV